MEQISKWVDTKNKLNVAKIGVQWWGFSQTGPPKFKLFNRISKIHEIFVVSKCERKIKFETIWGYQNGGPP